MKTRTDLIKTFETNGKTYKTNKETLELLTRLHAQQDSGAAKMVFNVALMTGTIKEIG